MDLKDACGENGEKDDKKDPADITGPAVATTINPETMIDYFDENGKSSGSVRAMVDRELETLEGCHHRTWHQMLWRQAMIMIASHMDGGSPLNRIICWTIEDSSTHVENISIANADVKIASGGCGELKSSGDSVGDGLRRGIIIDILSIKQMATSVSPNKASSASAASACDVTKQFIRLEGPAAKLDIQNIDTDMIIPGRFLKTIKRSGLGVHLFTALRFNDDGSEKADFILNQPKYRKSSILVAGDNFGCGSSREHAPWALSDFGVRSVISTSFADIFYNNCFKNGMLPIVVTRPQLDMLMADADAGKTLDIDLPSQTINRVGGEQIKFEVDPFRKHCLLNGLDDIGLTMQKADKISAFEKTRTVASPWLDNAAQIYSTV